MSLAGEFQGAAPRFDTAEAFLDWAERQPERYELVDGVVRMMTGGSRNHARIARNALAVLNGRLGSGPCEALGPDFAVILGPQRVVYPDVSVSCDPGEDRAAASPVVVVEVLSPSTAAYDPGDKATAYRRLTSLRHLVLVRQDRLGVQHYHREAAGEDFTLTELVTVDGVLALTAIGVELVVSDLYPRVSFPSP